MIDLILRIIWKWNCEKLKRPLSNLIPIKLLKKLKELVSPEFPSIRFGLETALLDLIHGGKKQIFPWRFFLIAADPIPINGLIWMGSQEFMAEQIEEKLSQGFDCIKMKIGAIDFEQEFALLSQIRKRYSKDQITLRVDANGLFRQVEALGKLKRLASLDLHSIEQPIAAGQIEAMRALCKITPLPIALDEELIGAENKAELLDQIFSPACHFETNLAGVGFSKLKSGLSLPRIEGLDGG